MAHVLHQDPHRYGERRTRWSLDSLQRACTWLRLRTAAGLSQLLKRLKIHYKRARLHVHSPDPNYLDKLGDIQAHIQRSHVEPELYVVLFQDELSYYRQPTLASAYELAGTWQPRAELSYQSNTVWRVTATLDIWTGQVLYDQNRRIGRRELVAFYQKVQQAYPQAQTIYIVQDNWPIHFHPEVLAALQPQVFPWPLHIPRNWPTKPSPKAIREWGDLALPIQLVPLPTYASWTNPIEKVWRKLKQEELHLHHLADDWPGLKQRVAVFLDQFAQGSRELLQYVGLSNPLKLYEAAFTRLGGMLPLRC